jgi:translation initiation factor IF-3
MFRGREVFHPEQGMKILEKVAEEVAGVGKVEAAPRLDGRNMTMVLAPDKKPAKKPEPGRKPGSADEPHAPDTTEGTPA